MPLTNETCRCSLLSGARVTANSHRSLACSYTFLFFGELDEDEDIEDILFVSSSSSHDWLKENVLMYRSKRVIVLVGGCRGIFSSLNHTLTL